MKWRIFIIYADNCNANAVRIYKKYRIKLCCCFFFNICRHFPRFVSYFFCQNEQSQLQKKRFVFRPHCPFDAIKSLRRWVALDFIEYSQRNNHISMMKVYDLFLLFHHYLHYHCKFNAFTWIIMRTKHKNE